MTQRHHILIGIGSNLQPESHVPAAFRALVRRFPGLRYSTFYLTRPLKSRKQPPFVNGVAHALTELTASEVLAHLAAVEEQEGRVRDPADRFAARTLDLDLLLYDHLVSADLKLPAPDLLARDFVLLPAVELLPRWRHPRNGRTLAVLARERFPRPVSILQQYLLPQDKLA